MPPFITAESLSEIPGVAHGFFTREGGVSSGIYESLNCGLGSRDDPAQVLENRRRVAAALGGAGPEVVTIHQIHSALATVVSAPLPRSELPKADAVVTRTPGLVVGALAADCAPILLADGEARIVAAAHAGWRGALAGIVEAAVAAIERLGGRRDRIAAAVGPCIGPDAYEVGTTFKDEFIAVDPGFRRYFVDGPHKPHFDLPSFVAGRLEVAGVGRVSVAAPCTFTNESKFFSYRRSKRAGEPDYGRHISAIVLT